MKFHQLLTASGTFLVCSYNLGSSRPKKVSQINCGLTPQKRTEDYKISLLIKRNFLKFLPFLNIIEDPERLLTVERVMIGYSTNNEIRSQP